MYGFSIRVALWTVLLAESRYMISVFSNLLAVLLQVSDSFSESAGSKVVPALGLTWSNYVTTRLMLSRLTGTLGVSRQNKGEQTPTVLRSIEILFSPYLPNLSCDFIIDQEGVKGIG